MNIFYQSDSCERPFLLKKFIIADTGIVINGRKIPVQKIDSYEVRDDEVTTDQIAIKIVIASLNPLKYVYDCREREVLAHLEKRLFGQDIDLDISKKWEQEKQGKWDTFESFKKWRTEESILNERAYDEITKALDLMLASKQK